jgi:PAS domain S-box-containing protein
MQFVSEGAAALTGYTAAEFESRAVSWGQDIIHPDDRDDTWEAVQQAVARGKSFELTYRIRTRDGDVRWCHERGTGVSENGDLVALEGYVTDITEQRRHEQKLEQYRTLVENVGDPMYVLDETGALVMANQAMADHLGFDREDILGSEPRRFMPDEDAERSIEVVRQLLAEDGTDNWQTWEIDAIHADGTRFRNETKTAIIYDDGEYAGSVGVIRDISDRKKRERELERYETIIEAVGDPVYALDDSGTFTYINDAIERMAGHDPADLVGEPIGTIVVDEDVEAGRRHIRELRDSPDRRATTYEVSVETTDGETIPCELHMALLSAPDGTFRGTAGVLRNIESRKRREQRLERFASVVSHDLRGPLNVVMGRTELARESDDPEHLRTVQSAVDRMDELIEELLTLARRGETVGSLERTRIDELAEEAWELVETEHASLDNGTTLSLEADPDRLRELFENLFRNAVEHGLPDDDTERITVSVGRLDDGGFYVADDGAGFTNGDPEDIFEYGYTTSDDGTGFGLAIVERIADAHGWDITVTDSAGGGARFEFRR